ncbi:MAG: hypothetical protein IIY49_07505 [Eubacterium sp.]|nr:hypothetical protein [Eubacterium sp.]
MKKKILIVSIILIIFAIAIIIVKKMNRILKDIDAKEVTSINVHDIGKYYTIDKQEDIEYFIQNLAQMNIKIQPLPHNVDGGKGIEIMKDDKLLVGIGLTSERFNINGFCFSIEDKDFDRICEIINELSLNYEVHYD